MFLIRNLYLNQFKGLKKNRMNNINDIYKTRKSFHFYLK
jgi:hypothetical protein